MSRARAQVLVVEDDKAAREALATLIVARGFAVREAESLRAARTAIARSQPDVVLTDLALPDGDGTELLAELGDRPEIELLVVTGNATVGSAVKALRLGAHDYLTKPIDEKRLNTLLDRLSRTLGLKAEVRHLRQELRQLGRFGPMVGTSDAMQELYDLIEKVAVTETAVLLVGESGTGKELAADTIHQLSRRRARPLVAINCGAVTPTLIESELFGHEKGAFTGATARHVGFFERADGGTLLLDEITEMSLDLQVKLLRVLESGRIQRVGGSRRIAVDVRVVAATNRPPEAAIDDGQLREDLYYRLNVFRLELPPLRARVGDIPLLVRHFLDELEQRDLGIARAALRALESHSWPGNVRELRNAVERATILADEEITASCLPKPLRGPDTTPEDGTGLGIRPGMTIAEAERRLILATLDELDDHKKETARALGISLKTLYNRLKKFRSD